MTKKLMNLAVGALTALAFMALSAGASAAEMEAHCSSAPCVGTVETTGHIILSEDSGTSITCEKLTGTVTQTAATSTTVSVVFTIEGCNFECQNEGAGTKKIVTNTMTGHLVTVTTNEPKSAALLLTGLNFTYTCVILGLPVKKTLTGNIIGTIENPECGVARTHHTIEYSQTAAGQSTDKVYTGNTFDLLANGTTFSLTTTTHINYGGKTVTITC